MFKSMHILRTPLVLPSVLQSARKVFFLYMLSSKNMFPRINCNYLEENNQQLVPFYQVFLSRLSVGPPATTAVLYLRTDINTLTTP